MNVVNVFPSTQKTDKNPHLWLQLTALLIITLARVLRFLPWRRSGPGHRNAARVCAVCPRWQSDEFKLGRHFMAPTSEKSHPKVPRRWKEGAALWGRAINKKDIHFWPFAETRWPMEKWRISPSNPLTAVLDPPLSADLSNLSSSLRCLSRLLGGFDVNTITKSFCCERLLSSFRPLGFSPFSFRRSAVFMLTWCLWEPSAVQTEILPAPVMKTGLGNSSGAHHQGQRRAFFCLRISRFYLQTAFTEAKEFLKH